MLKSIKIIREKYRILNQLKRARARSQTSLSINCYYLTKLPDMGTFNELRSLNIWDDALTTLPSVGNGGRLEALQVLGNGLTSLSALESFPHLQALNIWDDALKSMPDLDTLTQLQALTIEGNSLTDLPELNKLNQLRFLILEGIGLSSLPNLDKLVRLQSLTIGSNAVTELPELETLTEIQSLSIWGDRLTCLPGLSPLSQLLTLKLECRKLTQITSLPLHDGLKIRIGNTPLVDPPRSAIEAGMWALRKYYWDKNRKWIGFAGRWNSFLKRPAALALAQTLFIAGAAMGLLLKGSLFTSTWLLFSALAPLLLLRSRYSIRLGLSWFNKILGKKYLHHTRIINIPTKGFSIGLAAIPLRFMAVLTGLLRRPLQSLRAIPANWRYLITGTDLTSQPEIMPGSELAYCRKPETTLTISRLWRVLTEQEIFPRKPDYHDHDNDEHTHHRKRKPKALSARHVVIRTQTIIALAPFFLVANVFRILLQSTILVYWPLLFWNRVSGSQVRLKNIARQHRQAFIHQILRGLSSFIFTAYLSILVIVLAFPNDFNVFLQQWPEITALVRQPILSLVYFHSAVLGLGIGPWVLYALAKDLLDKSKPKHENFKWLMFKLTAIFQNLCILAVIWYGYEWLIKSLLTIYS